MARILIDYTPAVRQSAGIGRLTREVTSALSELSSPHQFTLFCMGKSGAPAQTPFANRVTPLTDRWLHRIWFRANVAVPVELFARERCDLYHATDFVLPPTLRGVKTVLTVHDLTFERDPDSAVPTLLNFLRRVVPASARRADHIIADSFATAHDLQELYRVPADKITVIHSGVHPRFSPAPAVSAIRSKYNLGDEPFALTVGTMQKRKNHLTLVRAFARMIERASQPIKLVIAGGKGWLYDEVLREIEKLNLQSRVKLIGFVDDADLPDLYRASRTFAFPSLYEGFGLPLLEAMACGVPVISSNVSSLPEVVGDAGLQVPPTDIGALSDALYTASFDEAWRVAAIARGIERAKQFSWHTAAQQLLAVYDRVLSTSS
jgi:glycosyltransferase involved in cell wall biosynthesis